MGSIPSRAPRMRREPAWVYTRFLKKLMRHQDLIDEMFDGMVAQLSLELEGFGSHLACDSSPGATRQRCGDLPGSSMSLQEDLAVS